MIKSARVMLVAVLLALPWAARADEPAADPATIPVTAFYGVLLQSMKDAKTLGSKAATIASTPRSVTPSIFPT